MARATITANSSTKRKVTLRLFMTLAVIGSQLFILIPSKLFALTIAESTRYSKQISAGTVHTYLLKNDGTLVGFGYNNHGELNTPSDLTDVIQLSAGWAYTCALKSDGTIVGWGDNRSNQCTAPAGLNDIVAVESGFMTTIVLRSNGTVVAWGDYASDVPTNYTDIVAIAPIYRDGSFMLRSNGTLVSWGYCHSVNRPTYPEDLRDIVAIAAGWTIWMALKADGTVYAWGDNDCGECNVPAGLNNVVAISAGLQKCVALKSDGNVVSWGCGSANFTPAFATNLLAVNYGDSYIIGLRDDGTPLAWGSNLFGEAVIPEGLNLFHDPSVANISVEYYAGSTQTPNNTIFPWLKITNTDSAALNLSDIVLRYYYSIDGDITQNFYCDWAQVGSQNVTGKFVGIYKPSADYYLEIGFRPEAGSLAPGASTELQSRFAKSDWSNYNQTNDYSYLNNHSFVVQNKIAGFHQGTLVWGTPAQ